MSCHSDTFIALATPDGRFWIGPLAWCPPWPMAMYVIMDHDDVIAFANEPIAESIRMSAQEIRMDLVTRF